ncbi:MAG TPA: TetR/AcrR family transcriptional regulator [Trebonia sp.]|jgi:AcrR family transcriptional regulator
MAPPNAAPRAATARERVRAELSREIKEEARRQLAASGAGGLSLRAVARELGMVSSALYRYYPSRDDLLTALIIDAYNALGDAAEGATAAGTAAAWPTAGQAAAGHPVPARERWIAACHAVRDWARANPHEYALVYGSPVPGYRAPAATSGPAARVPLAFAGLLGDALARGELGGACGTCGAGGAALPPDVLVRAVIAWTQLYGMISFELFGQFIGSFEPADALFAHTAQQLAAFVGLR